MTLTLKHFDTRTGEWITIPNSHQPNRQDYPNLILDEKLENTLLEAFLKKEFPDKDYSNSFSIGHLDEASTPDDLYRDHRTVYQAFCSDGPTFCEHHSWTYHCPESYFHDLHIQIGLYGRTFPGDGNFHGLYRIACGLPAGIHIYLIISFVYWNGDARASP